MSSNTLTIGWDQAPDTINPAVTGARSVGPIDQQIFDTLVYATPSGQITPDLAASWKVTNHGKTFTFQLRHGVTFQDGTPFHQNVALDVMSSKLSGVGTAAGGNEYFYTASMSQELYDRPLASHTAEQLQLPKASRGAAGITWQRHDGAELWT